LSSPAPPLSFPSVRSCFQEDGCGRGDLTFRWLFFDGLDFGAFRSHSVRVKSCVVDSIVVPRVFDRYNRFTISRNFYSHATTLGPLSVVRLPTEWTPTR